MALITKLSALSSCANIISTYNLLRHFLKEGLKEETLDNIEKRIIELEQSKHNYSFNCYFGIQPNKYIKDLKDKTQLVKREYDSEILIGEIKTKIHEVSSLELLSTRESIL